MSRVFVLNCGSSSLKYKLFDMTPDGESGRVLAQGKVERIGTDEAIVTHEVLVPEGRPPVKEVRTILEHRAAIARALALLTDPDRGVIREVSEIGAVGHRVVHGGESFSASARITAEMKGTLRQLIDLAPLHNPANLEGINAAEELLPGVPQVAVFDTAFHASMPPHAYLYAVPYVLYERHRVRRYGFHGTSHFYVSRRAARLMGQPYENLRIITCHLGNGASIAAVKGGRSVDTSMGFTPLEGLVMGTRSGDLDPGALFYIMGKEDLTPGEANSMLNKHSGLAGLCGLTDLRDVEAAAARGEGRAELALAIYTYRIRKYIGAYAAAMAGVDALVFTAGVGEHSAVVRRGACEGLEFMGIRIDQEKNEKASGETELTAPGSTVRVFVIPTDEELVIAQDAARIAAAGRAGGV